MDNGENKFTFTYSAPSEAERKTVEDIKKQYAPRVGAENKLSRLKALDARARNMPTVLSLVCGIIGTLVFGAGMALVLEVEQFLWGMIVSAVGIIPLALAYPVYVISSARLRAKYAPEILRLSDEILGDE